MAKFSRYLVFRHYDQKERPNISYRERTIFYGWTMNKSVVKVFLKQRTKSKYVIKKMDVDEIDNFAYPDGTNDVLDPQYMINYVNLQSAKTGESIPLFLTESEMKVTEKRIQEYFRKLASFSIDEREDIDHVFACMNMFSNLKERYTQILYFIGFRPEEFDMLFQGSGWHDEFTEMDEINNQIEMAYSGAMESPRELDLYDPRPIGLSALQDVSNRIIYSIESFVKFLREDL